MHNHNEKGGLLYPKTGVTHYRAQLRIKDKVVQSKSWLSAIVGI